MKTLLLEKDQSLWQDLTNQAFAFYKARQVFFQNCQDRVSVIKKALENPLERGVALDFFDYLKLEDRQFFFDDLVDLASTCHSDIEQVRKIILSFPKDWLIEHFKSSMNQVLEQATDEEYRCLGELSLEIDKSLTQIIIDKAMKSDDLDIQEVGEDLQKYILPLTSPRSQKSQHSSQTDSHRIEIYH